MLPVRCGLVSQKHRCLGHTVFAIARKAPTQGDLETEADSGGEGSQCGNDTRRRSNLYPLIFGDCFRDKSILEIGTGDGTYRLEALRRGAARAVCIEPYIEDFVAARAAAVGYSFSPEYIHADFESWASEEQFDVVICLNSLQQMYDPIHSLRKLVGLARETLP